MSIRVVMTLALLAMATEAPAFEGKITKRSESRSGNVKYAFLEGTYKLDANETISDVRIVYNVGQAAGTYSTAAKTWKVGVGDFELKSYRADFTVVRNGQRLRYSSPTYTYGR